MKVYADHAATTQIYKEVLEEMIPVLKDGYGNPSSIYSIGQEAAKLLTKSRETIAGCIGAHPREITFTSGGSEADNQAILTAAELGEKTGKKHMVTTRFEHHAILHTLQKLEKNGFRITWLEVHENGIVRPDEVEDAIEKDTILVSVMAANNEIGTIQPIGEIGEICRRKGVLFHTDAVQAFGHIPIQTEEMCIDMLSLSAHKFHGPKGVGILYARKGIQLTSLIEGGAQERGKRAGTENLPSIVGMAKAAELSFLYLEENTRKVKQMQNELIAGLEKIPHARLNGDREKRLSGNVNFCFEGVDGESLVILLDSKGIAVSSGSACASGSHDPSHVLLGIGLPAEMAKSSVRISIGEDNTEEEISYLIQMVTEVVGYLRKMSPVWRELEKGERQHVI